MAGGTAGEAILFIATIVIATAFVGVANNIISDFRDGVQSRGDRVSSSLRSDITVINDPEEVTVSPDPIIYIKNTGELTLNTADIDVLLDGQVAASLTLDVVGSSNDDELRPGEVLQVTVADIELANGDHRVRVVAANGVEDTLAIRV